MGRVGVEFGWGGEEQSWEMANWLFRDQRNRLPSKLRGSTSSYLKSWSHGPPVRRWEQKYRLETLGSNPKSPSHEVSFMVVVPVVLGWHAEGELGDLKICLCCFYRKPRAFICCTRVEALVALLCSLRHYPTVAPSAIRTSNISWTRMGRYGGEMERDVPFSF